MYGHLTAVGRGRALGDHLARADQGYIGECVAVCPTKYLPAPPKLLRNL